MKKMLSKSLLTISLAASISLFGMEEEKVEETMKTIRGPEDVREFEGKFVLFLADHYYFSVGQDAYLFPGTNLRIGLVHAVRHITLEDGAHEEKFLMSRLLNKDAVHNDCYFHAPQIKNTKLFMRAAHAKELSMILSALETEKAEIEYTWGKEKQLLIQALRADLERKALFD